MTDQLCDLTQSLLSHAKAAGADSADALAVSGTSVSIEVLNGQLEHAERSEGTEIGLRVLVGPHQACVSASDISDDTIREMAERAVAMAKLAPPDPHARLASADELARDWDLAQLDLVDDASEPSPEALKEQALTAEAAAAAVKGVSQVQSAGAGFGHQAIHLATSNGFSGGYGRTSQSVSTVAITGEGTAMERDYAGESRTHQTDMPDIAAIGTLAGERAVARAGSRKPPSGTYPVLFDERISSSLIGHLLAAINGATIARGGSWALDLMGKQILPAGIDLTEDPHRPRIGGSKPFDGEGLATRSKKIVQDGVLQNWVMDLSTASKLGLKSTANASRGVSAPPSPSAGNLHLTHGTKSQKDLLADMGTGLWVTSMIGSTINPTTGDYSRGASGFWVENGEPQYPVNECTIASNLLTMLPSMVIANDGRAHLSRVIPSVLIDGLSLAGE